MKAHVESKSRCARHCSIYSLSDPTSKFFQNECDHVHDLSCDDCGATDMLDSAILDAVSSIQQAIPVDIQEEINHDLKASSSNISNWKAHCLRTVHQEQARQNNILKLKPNQCLIIIDWAMKFLPIKHRGTQADFFGKRELVGIFLQSLQPLRILQRSMKFRLLCISCN